VKRREPPSVVLVTFCRSCGYLERAVLASQASQVIRSSGETPECPDCRGVRCDVLRFEYVRTVARATRGPLPFDYPSRAAQAQGGKR